MVWYNKRSEQTPRDLENRTSRKHRRPEQTAPAAIAAGKAQGEPIMRNQLKEQYRRNPTIDAAQAAGLLAVTDEEMCGMYYIHTPRNSVELLADENPLYIAPSKTVLVIDLHTERRAEVTAGRLAAALLAKKSITIDPPLEVSIDEAISTTKLAAALLAAAQM